MNFIESIFHVAPDGGSGLLELSLILIPLGAALLFAILRKVNPAR